MFAIISIDRREGKEDGRLVGPFTDESSASDWCEEFNFAIRNEVGALRHFAKEFETSPTRIIISAEIVPIDFSDGCVVAHKPYTNPALLAKSIVISLLRSDARGAPAA